MTKSEFDRLIKYLKNRPLEAERLVEVLGGQSESKQQPRNPDQWLTAREVGILIGQSSRWVRDRIKYLAPGAVKQSKNNNGMWLLNYSAVKDQLQQLRTT